MIYTDFKGKKISQLGMGCMRLPVINGRESDIDMEQTARMTQYAFQHGINYFDTAYGYHNGRSEAVMGEILKNYPRDSFYLATKFPGYDISNFGKEEEIFEEQLRRLQTDHVDFYLMHNICELNIDKYLDPQGKTLSYFRQQKENGRIVHWGFSFHGEYETLEAFLEVYGPYMEFGQLQLNYLDWEFQHAGKCLKLLESKGIPVVVMEPLRGGKLCSQTPEFEARLKALRPEADMREWAFRFIQSVPNILTVLSGMSSFDQMVQNIRTFEEEKKLNDEEMKELLAIASEMATVGTVPCTACRYCTSYCPQELDIPRLLDLYNEHSLTGGGFIAPMALQAMPVEKHPDACIACRACEAVCPQNIKIADVFEKFAGMLKNA